MLLKSRLFLAAAFFLAGTSVVAARYVSEYLRPFGITFLSLFFAVLFALPLRGGKIAATAKRLHRRQWLALALQAFFGIFLFRILLAWGLRHITASEAGIVTGTAPAITAALAWLLLREKLTPRILAAVACSVLGIVLLQKPPASGAGDGGARMIGSLLVFAAAACEALFAILAIKLQGTDGNGRDLHPIDHAALVSAMAMVFCAALMLYEEPIASIASLPAGGWLALLWYGGMVTVAAFACMFAGARHCDGRTISAFTGLIPLSALALSAILLGERITPPQAAGCLLVIASIGIVSRGASAAADPARAHP